MVEDTKHQPRKSKLGLEVPPTNNKDDNHYDHVAHAGLQDFNPEVTWVVKRYMPLDERTYAPVPRHKYILKPSGVPPPPQWIPPKADSFPEGIKFSRLRAERQSYSSAPYTRDEKWSTLREMLPSSGRAIRTHAPNWSTKPSTAPLMTNTVQSRFPIVESPMSRFVADMHLTNREFKLF
ncbi:hypothetical protein EB796_017693 [Bugula neritina]|uniref:Uncharacterized protein n=1 Tax=Bugula neritina TaxID=10212 RepID=A0A7J7JEF4_BUGNE|nr:hypothetical protein EB796_017693 [Bugula neritina]